MNSIMGLAARLVLIAALLSASFPAEAFVPAMRSLHPQALGIQAHYAAQTLAVPAGSSPRMGRRFFIRLVAAAAALSSFRADAEDTDDLTSWVQKNLAGQDPQELRGIESEMRTETDSNLAFSQPDNPYFESVTILYEQAREIRLRIALGHVVEARKTADFIIRTPSLRKRGWVLRQAGQDTRRELRDGWYVNAFRGTSIIEPLADVGPNAYFALSLLDLYKATGDAVYLTEAMRIAELIGELQVTDEADPNFGAFRMGPLGDLAFPQDQRALGGPEEMLRYFTFNTENTIDAYRLFDELAQILEQGNASSRPDTAAHYRGRMALVYAWLPKVYDKTLHYFYEGTYEGPTDRETRVTIHALVAEGEDPKNPAASRVVVTLRPGKINLIPLHPFDATHLVADALGPDRWDAIFGAGEFDAMLESTEDENMFMTQARIDGSETPIVLFDTLPAPERSRMIRFAQAGKYRDQKTPDYTQSRPRLGTIEWTAWYNFTLLQALERALREGNAGRVKELIRRYNRNVQSAKMALQTPDFPGQAPYAIDMDQTQATGRIQAANDIPFYAWQTPQVGFGSLISQIAYFNMVQRRNEHRISSPGPFTADPITFPVGKKRRQMSPTAGELPPVNEAIILDRLWALAITPDPTSWAKAALMIIEDVFGLHQDWIEAAKFQAAVAAEMAALSLNDRSLDLAGKIAALREHAASLQSRDAALSSRLQTLADEIEDLSKDFLLMLSPGPAANFVDKLFDAMTLSGVGGIRIRFWNQDAVPNNAQRGWERLLQSVYRTYGSLYHIGTIYFIWVKVNMALSKRPLDKDAQAYERLAVDGAKHILQFYSRAQAYDVNGWFWGIVTSLAAEYPAIYQQAMKELAAKNSELAPAIILDRISHQEISASRTRLPRAA